MSRFLKWRYGLALWVVALIAVACSEASKNPVAPTEFSAVPRFAAVNPANGIGACMGNDAFASGFTSGLGSATSLNCTANDIEIALATFTEATINGQTYHAGDVISCNAGDSIDLVMDAQLLQNANSARTDIGIWIARDGGDAETGSCQHYNLPNSLDGVFNLDSTATVPDNCGDMNAQDSTINVPLGNVRVACETQPGLGDSLHIGACLGWTQPGGDQQCPIGGSQTPQAYRYGTVPANKSKCNCDGFNLPISVNRSATIEVKKVCAPTSDGGRFDLNIDGNPGSAAGDSASCGGSTGAVPVGAGTSGTPGANHSVTETGTTGTPLTNYNSSFVCTQNGHTLSNGTGTNAGSITA
jgi:hypothetical protein